jgi:hypothetical protein
MPKGPWRVLSIETQLDPQLRTTEIEQLDLADPQDWPQMSLLIEGKFYSYLEDTHQEQYRDVTERNVPPPPELLDEYIIQQARTIGVRILFNPKVLMTLYRWNRDPRAGAKLWQQLSGAIQAQMSGRRLNLGDDSRTPRFRVDLINELKALKKELRKKRAVIIEWNFAINVKTLSCLLETCGTRLRSNRKKFVDYVQSHEKCFKNWLLDPRGSSTHLADEFLAYRYKYKNREAARQAVMERQTRNRIEAGARTRPIQIAPPTL